MSVLVFANIDDPVPIIEECSEIREATEPVTNGTCSGLQERK